MIQFTHLHVHTHYSILDGMSKVGDLIDKCKRTGMNAIAITDHGNMFGIKELVDTAAKVNGKVKDAIKDLKKELKKALFFNNYVCLDYTFLNYYLAY